MTMNCQQCGKEPTDAERAVIDRAMSATDENKPTGWICAGCQPPGYPEDGLCYSVVEVGGESPEHEYES